MKKEKTLKLKHKIGYGLGDCGGVMTFALMSSTFSMYCTDALGIKPGTIAALLLIWNIWDFEHLGFYQRPSDGRLHRQVLRQKQQSEGEVSSLDLAFRSVTVCDVYCPVVCSKPF